IVEHRRADRLERPPRTIPVQQADQAVARRAWLRQHLPHPNPGPRQIIRMDEIKHARPLQLATGVAEDALDRRALKRDRSVRIDLGDHIARPLDQLRNERGLLCGGPVRHLDPCLPASFARARGSSGTTLELCVARTILAVTGQVSFARWIASYTNPAEQRRVRYDGVVAVRLTHAGLCSEFREWWNTREQARQRPTRRRGR